MIQDLTLALTEDLKQKAKGAGDEFVFPYPEVIKVIEIACKHEIAVLGVEALEIRPDGLKVIDYSGYEFQFTGDWLAFVRVNNTEAVRFVESHRLDEGHGYILTSASKQEFNKLSSR
jgi:hypothetical protein